MTFKDWFLDKFKCTDDERFDSCEDAWNAAMQLRQAEIDRLNSVLDERTKEWLEAIKCGTYFQEIAKPLKAKLDEKDKRIEGLERQLKAVHTLARMRSAVITADRWLTLRPHIKKAIQCLDRKEKALRGERE